MALEIKDIPGNNFQLLNNYFLTGYESNRLIEHSQKINHPSADIDSYEWYFDGIRMSYSDWHYKKPVEVEWSYDIKMELVTFQANLRGSVFIGSSSNESSHLMGDYQHNLFYSPADTSEKGVLRSNGSHSSMFFMQFTKDAFLRLTHDANEALNRFGENVLNRNAAILSVNNLPMDATMVNLVNNILHCRYKDGLKKMYLLSKSIEFLVLQAETCNAAQAPIYEYVKTKYDQECIMYAREYIMSHLEEPPGLSELAKIIGINEYKLKRGFKEMFGNTVFGYLANARLEIAKNNLLENKKTVSEIAAELGYSSLQHFSSAFKEKFGISPGKLKR